VENLSITTAQKGTGFPADCIAGAIYRADLLMNGGRCPGYDGCYRGEECKKRREKIMVRGHNFK